MKKIDDPFVREILSIIENKEKNINRTKLLKAFKSTVKNWIEFETLYYKISSNKNHNLRLSGDEDFVIYNDKNKVIKTKLGKYLYRYYFVLNDAFVNSVMSEAIGFDIIENNIKIYKGKDIIDIYKNEGKRFKSCMGGRKSIFVELYAKNKNKVSLIVFKNHKARALLWTDDKGNKILDRIYPSGSKYVNFFKVWANKKGYLYRNKLHSHVNCEKSVDINDKKRHLVTLNISNVNFYPFLDTFRHLYSNNSKKKTITLSNFNYNNQHNVMFTSIYGCFVGMNTAILDKKCSRCGYESSNMLYSIDKKKYYCGYCY